MLLLSSKLTLSKMCNNVDVDRRSDKPISLRTSGEDYHGGFFERSNGHVRRTRSIEDIYLFGGKKEKKPSKAKRRKSTQFCSEHSKRRSSRSNSRRGSRHFDPVKRNSFNYENETARTSNNSSRRNSCNVEVSRSNSRKNSYSPLQLSRSSSQMHGSVASSRSIPLHLSEKQMLKHKKRRKVVAIIISTFCILATVCVLAVIVSLTHQSTVTVKRENSTFNVTYYTFSPHSGILCEYEDTRLCS